MPTVIHHSDLAATHARGITHMLLANRARLGSSALHVDRVTLDAGVQAPPGPATDAERFLYVIGGKGVARVGVELFPLEPESILWLEPGDSYSLEAGAETLDVLVCRAPAGE